ncbi:hypothetical protein AZE42_11870 [Rhizopogon vesiculosus]|uniref:Uncharacterized protein n=1 Tax=Rhizopogon vesiculosus TaxID=180088 RepID=A0A1J8PLP0_9AGAM|nr:hypothetical protein AZE42_11870 [Rhizopogon vesiculosus]
MTLLKEAVVNSPALHRIDYESGCEIILTAMMESAIQLVLVPSH